MVDNSPGFSLKKVLRFAHKLMKKNMRKGNVLAIAVMAFALVAFLFVLDYSMNSTGKWPWSVNTAKISNTHVACTMEAKLCPDGSSVGRVGPNCEFTPCPSGNSNISTNSTSSTTITDNCQVDADCALDICSGCSNKESYQQYMKHGGTLACMAFEGDVCACQQNKCVIADWKTYTNTEDHYTIKYPADYTQSLNGNTVEFQKNGDIGKIGLHLVTVSVFSGVDQNINSNNDLYTWAKNGFSSSAPIVAYHNNPRTVKLGENSFVRTDGDQGSSGIPEYFAFHNTVLYELTDLHPSTMTSGNQKIIASFHFTK